MFVLYPFARKNLFHNWPFIIDDGPNTILGLFRFSFLMRARVHNGSPKWRNACRKPGWCMWPTRKPTALPNLNSHWPCIWSWRDAWPVWYNWGALILIWSRAHSSQRPSGRGHTSWRRRSRQPSHRPFAKSSSARSQCSVASSAASPTANRAEKALARLRACQGIRQGR